jgi:hypothetical protein
MKQEFAPYEFALRLKKIGFDVPTFGYYQYTRLKLQLPLLKSETQPQTYMRVEDCSAPTYSQAFRWFREEHGLSCSIKLTDDSRHYYYDFIIYDSEDRDYNDEDCFDSCGIILSHGKFGKYEEAELACLDNLIKIVESKQQEL